MNSEVNEIINEISEDLIGYIGRWLDEDPYFNTSDVRSVMEQITKNVYEYCNLDYEQKEEQNADIHSWKR